MSPTPIVKVVTYSKSGSCMVPSPSLETIESKLLERMPSARTPHCRSEARTGTEATVPGHRLPDGPGIECPRRPDLFCRVGAFVLRGVTMRSRSGVCVAASPQV